jgi:hypothetical protein
VEERATLDAWAREQDTKPWLRFSTSGQGGTDPGDLTEAVGDYDAVKATTLGIANLKRSMQYVMPATVKPTEDFDDLTNLYGRMIGQWRTELNHVVAILGSAESQEKYGGQQGVRFRPVSRTRQKEAVQFLTENAFRAPTWLLPTDIVRRVEPSGSVQRVLSAQSGLLNSMLQNARLIRMSEYEHELGAQGYGLIELLRDVRRGIFSELPSAAEIDVYRRALQRAYVENLALKLNPPPPAPAPAGGGGGGGGGQAAPAGLDPKLSDINPAVRAELRELDAEIGVAIPRTRGITRAHLEDLRFRIDEALKNKPAGPLATQNDG